MDALDQAYKDAKELATGYDDLMKSVMEQLEPDFIEANVDNLTQGLQADGEPMPMYKGGSYMRSKERMGSLSLPHMDYKVTGMFHRSFKAYTDTSGTDIYATDDKAPFLEKRVNPVKLYGITPDNIDAIRDNAIKILQDEIRQSLGI